MEDLVAPLRGVDCNKSAVVYGLHPWYLKSFKFFMLNLILKFLHVFGYGCVAF